MHAKIFKEKVEDYAVLKIEQGEHGRRLGKISSIAKMAIGMKPNEFRDLTSVIYSTTPAAREKAAKKDKAPKTKLDNVVEQFCNLYSALTLLGHGERVERLLANRGIEVKETYEGSLTDRYRADAKGKKIEKLNAMWEEEMCGQEMPQTILERAKMLIDSAVTTKADIEVIREKFSGEELVEAATAADVKKQHLSKAIGIKVTAIKSGEDAADEKVAAVIEDAAKLSECMDVLGGGTGDEEKD
jgi:methylglyoxal synthase